MSARKVGLPLFRDVRAADMLQAQQYSGHGKQPIQTPYTPACVTPEQVGIIDPGDGLTFYYLADTGGVKVPTAQFAVVHAMQDCLQVHKPSFVLHGGDGVYFNGDLSQWVPQFWEPYAHLPLPIVMVPGNHDGDPDPAVSDPAQTGLATWLANFATATPQVPASDPQFEYGRHTQTLPSHDWAIEFQAVKIIALYSNVPSGGHFEQVQLDFLQQQLASAAADKPVIVLAHHPAYSADTHHGGSAYLGGAFDQVFAAAGRVPDVVLSGHVHNLQAYTRTMEASIVRYIVCGNGGYHNLHKLARDAANGLEVAPGVVLDYGDDWHYGFLTIKASGGKISGDYTAVAPGTMPNGSDATYIPGRWKF